MKLLQVIASNVGFRDPGHNAARLDALDRLLAVARENATDLVMLPGGYLTATSVREVPTVIEEVMRRAASDAVVIGGIDVVTAEHDGKQAGKTSALPVLPFYAFAVGPVTPIVAGIEWKQTSSTSANAAEVTDEELPGEENRVVDVAGWKVGVLICGELFSSWAREAFAAAYLKLALDLGHESMGTGVTAAMENIARYGGCAVAHAHHVAPHSGGSLHFVRKDGTRESTPIAECDWHGDPSAFWVAWRLRTV